MVFIKTVKGEVFGGYTSIGYKSRGSDYKDEKSFLFSLTNKKIYNSKKGKTIVLDYDYYGPSFYDAIVIGDNNMFEEGGYTKENSSWGKGFDGFQKIMKLIMVMENFIFKKLKFIKYYINK